MNVSICCGKPPVTREGTTEVTCPACGQPCELVDDLVEAVEADMASAAGYPWASIRQKGSWRRLAREFLRDVLMPLGVVRLAEDAPLEYSGAAPRVRPLLEDK